MANSWEQHLGDNDLVYGMPKRMSASVNMVTGEVTNTGMETYWR